MKSLLLSCCLFFLITACVSAQPVQYRRDADELSWVLTVEYPEYVIRECRFDGKITIARGTVSEANATLTFKDDPDTSRRSIVDGRQFLGKVEMRDNGIYLVEKDRENDFFNALKEKEPHIRWTLLRDYFRRIEESTSDKAESRHSISCSPLIADHDMGYELSDVSDANYMLNKLDFREKYSDYGNLDIFIVPHLGYLDLKVVKFNDEPDITLAQVGEIHDAAFRFLREARYKRLQAEREQAKPDASQSPEPFAAYRIQNLKGQAGETFILVNTSTNTHTINTMLLLPDSLETPPCDTWWEHGSPLKPREAVVIAHSEKLIQEDVSLSIGTTDEDPKLAKVNINVVKTNFPIMEIKNGSHEPQATQNTHKPAAGAKPRELPQPDEEHPR